MSGIEVTGLVLGSIPLIISALEDYADGVRTIKRMMQYKWELDQLVTSLQAEYELYRNTCEQLLNGLVSATAMEELVRDPQSPLWKSDALNKKLEELLSRSYKVYMKSVDDMNATIEEFRLRLNLSDEGKVSQSISLWKDIGKFKAGI